MCGEEILAQAMKCKHCGSLLDESTLKPVPQPNPLGNASLAIGILGATLMFGLILCSLASVNWKIIQATGTPLLICAVTDAFLALIGVFLGIAGLFPKRQRRATAVVGIVLCAVAVWLLVTALAKLSG